MIKTMTKFIAGFAAAASLLLAAGCTNQLDYVDDTTALNKFNVAGLKVTGLDAAYNGADIKLMVVEDKDAPDGVSYVDGKVASSHKDDKGNTVGYQSGTAYIKLTDPELFDGDSLHTSKFECYLSVGNDKIKVLSADGATLENAKLAVPSSPAGTSNTGLKSKFVDVVVTDGIGTFSFADKVDEPVNVTLYCVSLDLMNATAEDKLPDGVTVTTSDKAAGQVHQKYTVKMTGLKDNAGEKVVLGGSCIMEKDTDTEEDHWYWEDSSVFNQTISDNGEVEWSFYGADVSYIAYRTYGSGKGPEFVIAAAGDSEKKQDGNRLLTSSVSCTGDTNNYNIMFPPYAVATGKDVTLTIDVSKVKDESKTKADPVAKTYKIYIDGIKVINAPKPDEEKNEAVYITDADNDAERILFVPENNWGSGCHKYGLKDINSNGNFSWRFDEPVEISPNSATFKIGARLVTSSTESFSWDKQLGQGAAGYSAHYFTEEYADGHYTLVIDNSSSSLYEYLWKTDLVDYEFEYSFRKVILDKALESVELIGDFNGWKNDGTIAGIVDGKTTVFNVPVGVNLEGGFKIRTVGSWGPVDLGMPNGNIDLSSPVITKSGEYAVELTYSDAGITAINYTFLK